jgi:hypothetical protein
MITGKLLPRVARAVYQPPVTPQTTQALNKVYESTKWVILFTFEGSRQDA